jgi:siderophore synthetase component
MSTRDVLAYAPEHRPTVDLTLVEVPSRRWLAAGTPRPPLLPVHPRQLPIATAAGLRPVGPPVPARPLMSLRTLALANGYHVKTAVDVQMTSAVRTVSAAAVHNGPALSGLLAELARRTRDLVPLREFSAASVLVDGEPSRSLAAVWREAPHLKADEYALPYAALALRPDLVREHFDRLVGLLLRPALALLHVGVALEAHGQNALVVFGGGRPVRLLYRDFGGVRVSPRRLAHAGLEAPPLHGDLLDDDPERLRAKLFAAALSTVVTELVVTAAGGNGDRQRLWDRVAIVVRQAYADLPADARADAVALTTRPWPIKAMTAMRLSATPLDDVWTYLPNPLAGNR